MHDASSLAEKLRAQEYEITSLGNHVCKKASSLVSFHFRVHSTWQLKCVVVSRPQCTYSYIELLRQCLNTVFNASRVVSVAVEIVTCALHSVLFEGEQLSVLTGKHAC